MADSPTRVSRWQMGSRQHMQMHTRCLGQKEGKKHPGPHRADDKNKPYGDGRWHSTNQQIAYGQQRTNANAHNVPGTERR